MSQVKPAHPAPSPLAVPVLMGVVFLSLIGFGVVIPLLPFYATVFDASAWQVTSMFAVFAAGQFFGELIWGRLSDKIGRKPVILGTILMAALGYVALAFAPNIWFAIGARAVAGVFSGNISTIQGYIVDVTPQEKLAGRLGLIGSAFGIGFVVGPLLGGLLARPELGAAGFQPPLLTAAALCIAGAAGAAVFVRESRGRGMAGARRPGPLQALAQTIGDPVLRRLMGGTFLSFAGFSAMWSIFGLWGAAEYGWGPKMIGFVMALTGIAAATSQGLLSGWAVQRIGERPTVLVGLLVTAVFLFLEALGPPMILAIILMVILVIGHTTSQPATSALISRAAPAGRQGETLGANNASSAAARVLGPVMAGVLFSGVGSWAPFVLGGLLILPAAWLIGRAGRA
ncbi:MAG: MFS transporter [Caulobacteraceae bacterium]|nr:MFS transporter [Caulobacteraceae bacterium]MDX5393416.1 MFS transporter [Caulobacteraceae bacterium]